MLTPEKAAEVVDEVAASGADVGVVVAFGQLLPEPLLEAVPHGFVNVHFSLLPRWRGAAPVERAMLAGDAETGVCIMELDAGLDTGPVYARSACAIGGHETAGELRARLVTVGTELLVDDPPRRSPAPGRCRSRATPTYADKLTVDEFALDWSSGRPTSSPASCGPGNPRPGAWTTDHGGRLKIWRARALSAGIDAEPGTVFGHTRVATGDGALGADRGATGGPPGDAGECLARRTARPGRPARYVSGVRERRGRESTSPRGWSRSTRSCASRTARTRTSCCRRCCGQSNLDDRDRAFATISSTARCARSAVSTT